MWHCSKCTAPHRSKKCAQPELSNASCLFAIISCLWFFAAASFKLFDTHAWRPVYQRVPCVIVYLIPDTVLPCLLSPFPILAGVRSLPAPHSESNFSNPNSLCPTIPHPPRPLSFNLPARDAIGWVDGRLRSRSPLALSLLAHTPTVGNFCHHCCCYYCYSCTDVAAFACSVCTCSRDVTVTS